MPDGTHSRSLPFARELVVDLFAGGGGASLGIANAYRHPDVAVNHSPCAIAVHEAGVPIERDFMAEALNSGDGAYRP